MLLRVLLLQRLLQWTNVSCDGLRPSNREEGGGGKEVCVCVGGGEFEGEG